MCRERLTTVDSLLEVIKVQTSNPAWRHTAIILVLRKLRQKDHTKCETSLKHMVIFCEKERKKTRKEGRKKRKDNSDT